MIWYDMIWYDITFQIIISDMADVSIDIVYVKSSRSYILFLFVCTYKCILFFTIYYNIIMFSEITEIFYLSSHIHTEDLRKYFVIRIFWHIDSMTIKWLSSE